MPTHNIVKLPHTVKLPLSSRSAGPAGPSGADLEPETVDKTDLMGRHHSAGKLGAMGPSSALGRYLIAISVTLWGWASVPRLAEAAEVSSPLSQHLDEEVRRLLPTVNDETVAEVVRLVRRHKATASEAATVAVLEDVGVAERRFLTLSGPGRWWRTALLSGLVTSGLVVGAFGLGWRMADPPVVTPSGRPPANHQREQYKPKTPSWPQVPAPRQASKTRYVTWYSAAAPTRSRGRRGSSI